MGSSIFSVIDRCGCSLSYNRIINGGGDRCVCVSLPRERLMVLITSVCGDVVLMMLSVLVIMTSRSEVGVLEDGMSYI